jgi:hypothetical protein
MCPVPGSDWTLLLTRFGEDKQRKTSFGHILRLARRQRFDIDAAASRIKVQGARYPKRLEQMTGR